MLDISTMFPGLDQEARQILESAPQEPGLVMANNDFRNALDIDDKRYVETSKARHEKFKRNFLFKLGYDQNTGLFIENRNTQHVLFFGHVGCGKSTELRKFCKDLHHPDRYWVVQMDLSEMLDPHNIRYCDVWLAVTQRLVESLLAENIKIAPVMWQNLYNWFQEKILVTDRVKELSSDLKAEIEGGPSLPLIGKLTARYTQAIRMAASQRETIREVLNANVGEFLVGLNQLLTAVRTAIRSEHKGRQLLIAIDGPDRFRSDDWKRFFVDDGAQLAQAECVVIYTAPLALKANGMLLPQFEHAVLPMVKLYDFETGEKQEEAFSSMRQIILRRCHYSLFDKLETLDQLIEYSGGNLRDMLRLLSYACVQADALPFDMDTIKAAATDLAADFRAWLLKTDYLTLWNEDQNPENVGSSSDISRLVERGALLEYNTGSWRRTHPVIQLLAGYKNLVVQATKT